jgi:uncharacterized repeat protein (TIGR04138 family)
VKTEEVPPLVRLLCEDRRYKLEAYQFVRTGLTYAQEMFGLAADEARPQRLPRRGENPRRGDSASHADSATRADKDDEPRPPRHISGQELCHALRKMAHEQYGRLAKLVLAEWGIRSTSDFGEIVYNLIKIGEMSKSDGDQRSDFDDVYDFDAALVQEFAIRKED